MDRLETELPKQKVSSCTKRLVGWSELGPRSDLSFLWVEEAGSQFLDGKQLLGSYQLSSKAQPRHPWILHPIRSDAPVLFTRLSSCSGHRKVPGLFAAGKLTYSLILMNEESLYKGKGCYSYNT